MSTLEGLRLFFGAVVILFLPGFVWSFVFFNKRGVDWLERIAISFGLSIAIVPLTVFWLNWLFHVRITILNVGLIVAVLTILPAFCLLLARSSPRKEAMTRLKNVCKSAKAVAAISIHRKR